MAVSTDLEEAINKYYSGHPDQAISIIGPLALSGDADAQFLLGNILYGLSKSTKFSEIENSVKWYRLAAEQDSAPANYALGVIYNNNWVKTHKKEDAKLARLFHQIVVDLGYNNAQAPLNKLTEQSNSTGKSTSLIYTNSSFSSKQKRPIKPKLFLGNQSNLSDLS
jgi:TPR repeat protein